MFASIRNRIKGHRRDRAGDLVPHEWNFRIHSALQRAALEALHKQVSFARSLLAYQLPDSRLKLIDGHLRRDIDPNMEVDVEVLDVTDEEARVLLLSIDPLAELAEQQEQLHQRLRELTPARSEELEAACFAAAEAQLTALEEEQKQGPETLPEQYYVLVTCRDEAQQRALLERFGAEGLECRAIQS